MEKRRQPRRWIVFLFFALCTLAMPFVSVFLTALPDWVPALMCVPLLLTGLWAARGAEKKFAKVLNIVFMCLLMLFSLAAGYVNPYWNNNFRAVKSADLPETLTREQALEDLDYAVKFLSRRHPAAYGGLPAEAETAYMLARGDISAKDSVTAAELFRAVESVFSTFGDAHTSCAPTLDGAMARPLMDMLNEYESVTLLTVNGRTREEWLESHGRYVSYEAESWGTRQMVTLLEYRSGLEALGIPVEEGVTYVLLADGEEVSVTCYPEDFITWAQWYEANDITPETDDYDFVSYTIDTDRSLAVLTLKECTYNQHYRDTLADLFRDVRRKGIRSVAVDLRGNGGGNSMVADEFIRYLDVDEYKVSATRQWRWGPIVWRNNGDEAEQENRRYEDLLFRGKTYVLTDTCSFSSAMMFAEYLQDNGLAVLIGEAPGNDPNGYGDITACRLPNSDLLISVSTKEFRRADGSAESFLVEPDVPCASDEAMEKLYELLR